MPLVVAVVDRWAFVHLTDRDRDVRRQSGRPFMIDSEVSHRANRLTAEWVGSVTRLIYVWVPTNLHNRIAAFQQLPSAGRIGGMVPGAPPNRAAMLTSYIESAERMVACPNQDVAYSVGSLAPRQSPAVIQVPDFGDRFWV
jgi:hypothetical protein